MLGTLLTKEESHVANNDFIIISLNLVPNQIHQLSTVMINGIMHIRITLTSTVVCCPYCGGKANIHGYSARTYNHLPIFGHPSVIEWKRRRYRCKDCRMTFMEDNPFGPENYHQSYAVLDSIAKDLRNIHFSFKDIAHKHHVSEGAVQLYADSFLQVPRMTLPVNLGIDEIHSKMAKYGGSYLAVLVDNDRRALCDILPDRSKRTLSRYFESIPKEERSRVKYVTIDLWAPYRDVAMKYFKGCHVAADPFHVVEHLSMGFTRIRVDIMNQCVHNSPEYYLLKKWHKLLETDYYLDNTPKYNSFFRQKLNYRNLYDMLLALNPELTLAYKLKEMYRDFNKKCSYEEAPAQLTMIIEVFEEADLYCYRNFVELLHNWRQEIIYSFERPMDSRKQSNALTENVNSRLRELLDISNGYANFERFRARGVYCLNDTAFYSLTQKLTSNKRQGKPRGKYNKEKPTIKDHPGNDVDTMDDDFDEEE